VRMPAKSCDRCGSETAVACNNAALLLDGCEESESGERQESTESYTAAPLSLYLLYSTTPEPCRQVIRRDAAQRAGNSFSYLYIYLVYRPELVVSIGNRVEAGTRYFPVHTEKIKDYFPLTYTVYRCIVCTWVF